MCLGYFISDTSLSSREKNPIAPKTTVRGSIKNIVDVIWQKLNPQTFIKSLLQHSLECVNLFCWQNLTSNILD